MFENLNSEQQKVVKNVIGKVDKLPYILFGPPGEYNHNHIIAHIDFSRFSHFA